MIISRLELLQEAVFEILRDRWELSGKSVFLYRPGDMGGMLDIDVHKQTNLCVIVLPPVPVEFRRNWPVPYDATVAVRILVVENAFTDVSTGGALGAAEFIHSMLTGRRIQCDQTFGALMPKLKEPWKINENFTTDMRLEILLTFEFEMSFPWSDGKEK
ncbi:MAG: hypothetical protein LBF26_02170 [Puniceicoccales bacterium]|jgi:hypothetical protein|nr:hypothetical protein [Puniceicoccales bacterium]